MRTIMILSCGTTAGWHVVKNLRKKFTNDFRIIGTDTNDVHLVPCAGMLDAFYKVPPSNSVGFLKEIEDVLKAERPDYILPSFDFDQRLFYNGAEILTRYGVCSLSTPAETLCVYEDKLRMFEAMKKVGLPVPKCFKYEEIVDNEEYFVKPLHGYGSKGAHKMLGYEILSNGKDERWIIQELCNRPEITMECFVYNNSFSFICRERLETKAGVCTKARVFKSPMLEKLGRRFAQTFKTPAFFNLQFMKTLCGKLVITDVNLRLAGGMGLSCAAGWDEVSAIARVMLGMPERDVMATLPEFVPEQYVVRVGDDHPTKVASMTVAFDLDGTLLDSRVRHCRVMEHVLKRRGVDLDVSDLVEYKRMGRNNIEYLVANGIELKIAKEIQRDWIDAIEENLYLDLDVLYADSKKLLMEYDGWKRILLTARKNAAGVATTLQQLGIDNFFDKIFVVAPGESAAAEKANILVQEKALLFYGDTRSDCKAAVAADVPFKFRDCGFHSYETAYEGNLT